MKGKIRRFTCEECGAEVTMVLDQKDKDPKKCCACRLHLYLYTVENRASNFAYL